MTDSLAQTRLDRVFEPTADLMDNNGHMNVGNYALVFDRAFRQACEPFDLRSSGAKLVTRECHIVYLREVLMGQRFRTALQVIAIDDTRVHFTMTLSHHDGGAVAATYEGLAQCVAIGTLAPMAWPAQAASWLGTWMTQSEHRGRLVETGRAIRIRRKEGAPAVRAERAANGAELVAIMDAIDYPEAVVLPEHVDADGELLAGWLGPLISDGMERLSHGGLGMGSMNAQTLGQTAFVLESHTVVQRPLRVGDPLHFDYVLLDSDEKRTHGITIARHRTEGWVAATMEQIGTCVDVTTRRSAPWHPTLLARVEAIKAAHADRAVGLERSRAICF